MFRSSITHAGPGHWLKGRQVHVKRIHPEPPSPAPASHSQSQHRTRHTPVLPAATCLTQSHTGTQIAMWPSTTEVHFQEVCRKCSFCLYLFVFPCLSISVSFCLCFLCVLLSLSLSVPILTPSSVSLTPSHSGSSACHGNHSCP